MKALLAKIPRDRSLLLLLVPPIAVLAFVVNAQSQANYALPPPTPVGAPAATTPTTLPDLSSAATGDGQQQVDEEVAGVSVSRSGVTRSAPTGSSGGSTARSTGSGSGASGSGASGSGVSVPAEVQGESVENTSTTIETTTPTTTLPEGETGPSPAVSESPFAVLLPMSALLMLGIGLFLVLRRRKPQAAHRASA
jgi:cobalamin biosynthesis Mg chelatase CobN